MSENRAPEVETINLATIADSAAMVMFEEELAKVLANIANPNTDPKATRSIKIVLKFKPDEDREGFRVYVQADSKLVPLNPVATACALGKRAGELVAVEFNAKQLKLDLEAENKPVPFEVAGRNGGDE